MIIGMAWSAFGNIVVPWIATCHSPWREKCKEYPAWPNSLAWSRKQRSAQRKGETRSKYFRLNNSCRHLNLRFRFQIFIGLIISTNSLLFGLETGCPGHRQGERVRSFGKPLRIVRLVPVATTSFSWVIEGCSPWYVKAVWEVFVRIFLLDLNL